MAARFCGAVLFEVVVAPVSWKNCAVGDSETKVKMRDGRSSEASQKSASPE